jgi:hypothetical protein
MRTKARITIDRRLGGGPVLAGAVATGASASAFDIRA